MLVARLIPPGSATYQRLRERSRWLDGLMDQQPEHWFGVWIMSVAGINVSWAAFQRYYFWDFSQTLYGLTTLIVVTVIFALVQWKKSWFTFRLGGFNTLSGYKTLLLHLLLGWVLFAAAAPSYNLSAQGLVHSLPYLSGFLALVVVYSIPLSQEGTPADPFRRRPGVFLALVLVFIACGLGVVLDDPVISTIAVVYSPFLVVALILRPRRHLERARIWGIFIPAMFLAVRLPWFLVPLGILFFGLRTYHYFRHGKVYPTFKVV